MVPGRMSLFMRSWIMIGKVSKPERSHAQTSVQDSPYKVLRDVHPVLDKKRRGHTGIAPNAVWPNAGVTMGCFAAAFSGSFRGLKLIPIKWCNLAPPTSPHQGATLTD